MDRGGSKHWPTTTNHSMCFRTLCFLVQPLRWWQLQNQECCCSSPPLTSDHKWWPVCCSWVESRSPNANRWFYARFNGTMSCSLLVAKNDYPLIEAQTPHRSPGLSVSHSQQQRHLRLLPPEFPGQGPRSSPARKHWHRVLVDKPTHWWDESCRGSHDLAQQVSNDHFLFGRTQGPRDISCAFQSIRRAVAKTLVVC